MFPATLMSHKRQNEEQQSDDEGDDIFGIKRKRGPIIKIRMFPTQIQRDELLKAFAVQREAFNFAADLVQKHDARPNWLYIRTAWLGWKKEIKDNKVEGVEKFKWILEAGFPPRIDACGIRELIKKRKETMSKKIKKPKTEAKSEQAFIKKDPKRLIQENLILEHSIDGKAHIQCFFPMPYTSNKLEDALCLFRMIDLPFRKYHSKYTDLQYFILENKSEVIQRLVDSECVDADLEIIWNKRTDQFHLCYSVPLSVN